MSGQVNQRAPSSGWIISPTFDLSVTWGIIFLGLLIFQFFHFEKTESWSLIHYYFIWAIVDVAHIFASYKPVQIRIRKGLINVRQFLLTLLMSLTLPLILIFFSFSLFIKVLAAYAIFHIYAQQNGLMLMIRAKMNEKNRGRVIDQLLLFVVFWFPVSYWLSDYHKIPQSYYHKNDFSSYFSKGFVDGAHWFFWAAVIIMSGKFIYEMFKKESINWPKFSLMYSTAAWTYIGLVLLDGSRFFWLCLVFVHGGFYTAVVIKEEGMTSEPGRFGLKSVLIFLGIIILASFFWFRFFKYIELTFPAPHILLGIAWVHLVSHYVFDSYIWRKKFSPFSGVGGVNFLASQKASNNKGW